MLEKKSKKLLKALYKVEYLPFEDVCKITGHSSENTIDPATNLLSKLQLIKLHWTGETTSDGDILNNGYEITIEGRAYVEKIRHDFWSFLLPYSLTTFIALLSLLSTLAANWQTIRTWFQG